MQVEKENPPKVKFIYYLIKIGFFYTLIPTIAFCLAAQILGSFKIINVIGVFFILSFLGYILSSIAWEKQNNQSSKSN